MRQCMHAPESTRMKVKIRHRYGSILQLAKGKSTCQPGMIHQLPMQIDSVCVTRVQMPYERHFELGRLIHACISNYPVSDC